MANTHINEYIVKDYLIKNIHLTYDIVILKPEFLTKNISNVQFYLTDKDGKKTNLLDGLKFQITFSESCIYSNILESNKDLFIYSDIPFGYVVWFQGCFILEGIQKDLIATISDYKINFVYTESTTLVNYPPNVDPPQFETKWHCGLIEDKPDDNKLRFIGGMLGCEYNSNYIDDEFYNQNHKVIFYPDEILDHSLININYLDEQNNWVPDYQNHISIYSMQKLLNVLIYRQIQQIQPIPNNDNNDNNNNDNNNNDNNDNNNNNNYITSKSPYMVSKTFKLPLNKIKLNNQLEKNNFISHFQFTLKGDGITNIELLCDNKKYLINKLYLDLSNLKKTKLDDDNIIYEQMTNTYELEFEISELGYKVLGLDNFFIIPTITNNNVLLRIEFEIMNNLKLLTDDVIYDSEKNIISDLFDDFWIKYNLILLDTKPRIEIHNNKNDYEEYPIIDVLDYFPKIILHNFDLLQNNHQLVNYQHYRHGIHQPLNLQPVPQLNLQQLLAQPNLLQPVLQPDIQRNDFLNIFRHIINKYCRSKYFILSFLVATIGIIGMIVSK